ncbi:hypothetical protein INT43_009110 [Umbelopsis isabellina]|uniref:Amino acid transporter transmembrane domain-containing protein n=1 Tax=Mortierella isabellina TaxID=91625 RepID=A0A8H7PCN4_MORIS|nr:hypothetical protein INT43_009110 [Umbelopsis isabellina]
MTKKKNNKNKKRKSSKSQSRDESPPANVQDEPQLQSTSGPTIADSTVASTLQDPIHPTATSNPSEPLTLPQDLLSPTSVGNHSVESSVPSEYHPEVSEDKLVKVLQQHLVVDESPDLPDTASDTVGAPENVAPIPYHLPGAAVTSDIYKMSNELAQKNVSRSKSTADMQEHVEQVRQTDDPVLENVSRPGGFRRYFVDQQQQQRMTEEPEDLESGNNNGGYFDNVSRYGATTSPAPAKRTRHFLEFMAVNRYQNLYDSFAGEYLADEDEESLEEELSRGRRPEQMPLLTRKQSYVAEKDKASTTKTFFLLLKAFVGSGILFLPKAIANSAAYYSFSNGGVLFSTVMLWVVASVSLVSFLLLIKCKDYITGGFGDIGEATYGRWMRVAVLVSITLSQLGFVAGASSFIAENLSKALHDINPHINISPGAFLVLSGAVMVPLVLIRKIAKLSFAAVIADVLIVVGLITLVCADIVDLLYTNKKEGDTRMFAPGPDVEWIFNRFDYAVFIGTAIYAFEGIGLIIPIRDAMKKPEHFPRVLVMVMVIVGVVLTIVGGLGYIANGSRTETVALLNLPNNWISHTIQIMYAIAMLLSNPLTFFPAVRIIEQGLFGYQTGRYDDRIKWAKNALRTALLTLALVVAWAASSQLDKFISLLGSVCCSPLSLIFPPLFHYKAAAQHRWQKILDLGLVVAGIIAMIFTLTQTITAP